MVPRLVPNCTCIRSWWVSLYKAVNKVWWVACSLNPGCAKHGTSWCKGHGKCKRTLLRITWGVAALLHTCILLGFVSALKGLSIYVEGVAQPMSRVAVQRSKLSQECKEVLCYLFKMMTYICIFHPALCDPFVFYEQPLYKAKDTMYFGTYFLLSAPSWYSLTEYQQSRAYETLNFTFLVGPSTSLLLSIHSPSQKETNSEHLCSENLVFSQADLLRNDVIAVA